MTAMRESGFTILETMLAMGLVGVLALMVFTSYALGLTAASLANDLSQATDGTAFHLERYLSGACTSMPIGTQGVTHELTRNDRTSESLVDTEEQAGLYLVTVRTNWLRAGRRHSVVFTTLRYVPSVCRS